MRHLTALVFTLVVATQNRCDRGSTAESSVPVESGGSVTTTDLTHLFTQQNGPYRQEAEQVVRDAAAWAETWRALHGGTAAAAAPAVDFAREMVVLVALGERSTGGYTVRVDAVTIEPGGGAVVRYTATEPGPGCMTTQAFTTPVDVVRAPRANGAVRFDRRTVKQAC